MNRRAFPQTGTAGLATVLAPTARAYIPEHSWEKYGWGSIGHGGRGRVLRTSFPITAWCEAIIRAGSVHRALHRPGGKSERSENCSTLPAATVSFAR